MNATHSARGISGPFSVTLVSTFNTVVGIGKPFLRPLAAAGLKESKTASPDAVCRFDFVYYKHI